MTSNFQKYGRALLSNGYLIVPIKPGHKRPALDNWQTARLGAPDLTRYPSHGVGVLCGQGAWPVVAVDVDTTDEVLSARFVAWCQEHLGFSCERVGKAPKILLVYRADAEGWGKAASAWFAHQWQPGPKGNHFSGGYTLDGDGKPQHNAPVHRLEVLGKGQQFVAYHTHPETGRPYEWVDFFGGLDSLRVEDLPVITLKQVEEALRVFAQMAGDIGLAKKPNSVAQVGGVTSTPVDDPLMAFEPPVGIDLGEARRLLSYVDNEDYDTWVKVGMSLHHEFDGDGSALDLWDEWSSTASNYANRDDLEKRWDSFGRSGRNPTTARWLLKVGNQGKRDVVKAEKRTALDDAKGLILSCEDSIDLVNEVARKAGEAAGTDLALRAELAGLIRARFKDLTGTNLPVADVRAAMAGGRKVVAFNKQRRQMTEFGNAERMLDHYGEGLMYVPEIDGWFMWTGIYWRRAAGVELEHLAKETIRALPDEAKEIESDGERAEFFKFCAISQRAVMVRNMVNLAQSDPRIVVGVCDLDKTTHLLGVGNGVVDLTTGVLIPPDPTYRVTTITDTDYDALARAPLFEQTVADVFFGDKEMIGFFQRLIGYSLLGKPDEDILAIPYGSGSNGKSTVMGAIRGALGDHAKMASADTFLSSGAAGGNAGSAREDVLRLRGARFVYVSEPDEGSELREGLIKSMTGGEPLPARGLYSKTTVEVMPTWVAFMPTNHRPIVKGDDHAIWRRLLPIAFTRNFDLDLTTVKDPDRAAKLVAEARGILTWCVRGALAYQKIGLQPPAAVRKARDDYKNDMDLLAEWLDECCEVGPGHVETNARLWASWEAFAKARGELRFIASAKSLGRRLQSKGMEVVKDTAGIRGRGHIGLRVRQIVDFE